MLYEHMIHHHCTQPQTVEGGAVMVMCNSRMMIATSETSVCSRLKQS